MEFDLDITKPEYHGGSIVNLMASIKRAFGLAPQDYPELAMLTSDKLRENESTTLLVIDGLGADLLREFSADPKASGRLEENLCGRMTSVYPPTTASAITTFMSGQAPQQHGLTGWFMNFREIGMTTAVLPFMARGGHGCLSEQGINIADLVDCDSLSRDLPVKASMLLPAEIADSDFSNRVGDGAISIPYSGLDDFIEKIIACQNENQESKYLYAYWPTFDHLCHIHGPSDSRVFEHFLALEQALEPVLDNAKKSGNNLLITADHGFLDSGPNERIEMDDHPIAKAMLAAPLFGEPRSAYCNIRKGCDDEFEDYINSELGYAINLIASAELIAQGWFGLGEPHPELGARVGDYTLQMKERYTIKDTLPSERPFDLYGMHGGVTAAEQWVPLIVA